MLTPRAPTDPPFTFTLFYMDPNDSFSFLQEKARLTRAAEAEARAARTAAQQAARVAERLAGGNSASGGGCGGVSTNDTLLNTCRFGGGAAGAPTGVPRP